MTRGPQMPNLYSVVNGSQIDGMMWCELTNSTPCPCTTCSHSLMRSFWHPTISSRHTMIVCVLTLKTKWITTRKKPAATTAIDATTDRYAYIRIRGNRCCMPVRGQMWTDGGRQAVVETHHCSGKHSERLYRTRRGVYDTQRNIECCELG